MKKLYGFLLIIYYGTVSSVFLPVTKTRGSTKPPLLPPELTEDDLYKLKIPNKRFCDEMEKKLRGRYLVVPWLFQNCQVIKDNTAKNLSRSGALPVHKAITMLSQLTNVHPRKKYKVRSSESIENILYYKDCNHKKTTEAPLRSPPQPECKISCTMCCGDQCVNNNQFSAGRQAQGVNIEPIVQPIVPNMPQRERRKKNKPIPIQPLPKRRGLTFTRENIKSLISTDGDIRKILKDLVRVTMQKVDLMQTIKAKKNVETKSQRSADYSDAENDL